MTGAAVTSCGAVTSLVAADQLQVDQERARSQAVSRLLSNASHELRTPLNGIIATLELLSLTPLTGEQSEYAKTMQESAQHLLVVVSDLLDYNKLAEGKLQLEARPLVPSAVAQAAVAMMTPLVQAKGLKLLVDVAACEGLRVLGDATRLKQVGAHRTSRVARTRSPVRLLARPLTSAYRHRMPAADAAKFSQQRCAIFFLRRLRRAGRCCVAASWRRRCRI